MAGHVSPNRKLFGGTVLPNSLPQKEKVESILLGDERKHVQKKITKTKKGGKKVDSDYNVDIEIGFGTNTFNI